MSDMIERVGLAIARHIHEGADYGLDGDTAFESRREDFLGMARAAIEAMREPDTSMLRGLLVHRGYDPDAKEESLDKLGQFDIATMGIFVSAYRAMIDAALSQDTHSLPSEDR